MPSHRRINVVPGAEVVQKRVRHSGVPGMEQ